jgi:hypothetical protein
MPKGTKVDKMYQAIKSSSKKAGMSDKDAKAKAAKIAQAKTGKSLATGKKPKKKGTVSYGRI